MHWTQVEQKSEFAADFSSLAVHTMPWRWLRACTWRRLSYSGGVDDCLVHCCERDGFLAPERG